MANSSPLVKIHAADHEELLNVIDQLRAEGLQSIVNLPQLIVCGDQSSGKSSVLEAISGLGFPAKDSVCTRFATELILRRTPDCSVKVGIIPTPDHSPAEKKRLISFAPSTTSLEHFEEIVGSAAEYMGVGDEGYSKDTLRVEVFGPEQPNLTLVDLPGLYHAADETQNEDGVDLVENLVLSHMQNKRSVILAVMSAKSEIALQKITKFTRKIDPSGKRTMGIITKPDLLERGSNMEQSFYDLASNQRVQFGLGWHVLKNRSYEERDVSLDKRHQLESDFLQSRPWKSLPSSQRGIGSLRPRLSSVLQRHIISELPSLLTEAQDALKSTQASLTRLGIPRQALSEQRQYLLQICGQFTQLISDAVNGTYINMFFGDALDDDGYSKRLRAVVQNHLQDFSDTMFQYGHRKQIIDSEPDSASTDADREISRSEYIEDVKERMRRSRGRELSGTYNPLIVGELFYTQSTPWEGIALGSIETLLRDAQRCVMLILEYVVKTDCLEKLLKHVITPELEALESRLRTKTNELLLPQQSGHPITYNAQFAKTIQQARREHLRNSIAEQLKQFFGDQYPSKLSHEYKFTFRMNQLIEALESHNEDSMETFACSEAVDCMQAYYKVAREKFVDDFGNLAVEACLLQPLSRLFSPQTVATMPDETIRAIAEENETTRMERVRLTNRTQILKNSLRELRRLERYSMQSPINIQDANPDTNADAEPSSEANANEDMERAQVASGTSEQEPSETPLNGAATQYPSHSDHSPAPVVEDGSIGQKIHRRSWDDFMQAHLNREAKYWSKARKGKIQEVGCE